MDTVAVTLSVPSFDQDTLIAAVNEDALNGILQEDDRLVLHMPASDWTPERHDALRQWLVAHGYRADDLSVEVEAARNWNAAWEQTLRPIRAGEFVITPSTESSTEPSAESSAESSAERQPSASEASSIVIDPEMSFGTGHHASTRLALHLLPDAVAPGARVLDAGTGTGILAIAACLRGAASVVAFDTHLPAVENARANADRNGWTDRITVRAGSLDTVAERGFDAILANITREVLRTMLPGFAERIAPGGQLVLAGLLASDRDVMRRDASAHGFALAAERDDDGWWAARFAHSG